jgi:hypothetical protein
MFTNRAYDLDGTLIDAPVPWKYLRHIPILRDRLQKRVIGTTPSIILTARDKRYEALTRRTLKRLGFDLNKVEIIFYDGGIYSLNALISWKAAVCIKKCLIYVDSDIAFEGEVRKRINNHTFNR